MAEESREATEIRTAGRPSALLNIVLLAFAILLGCIAMEMALRVIFAHSLDFSMEMWKYAMILHPFPAFPADYHPDSARTPFIPPGPILSHERTDRVAAGTLRGRPFDLRRTELSGRRAERFECACSVPANYDQFSAAASS